MKIVKPKEVKDLEAEGWISILRTGQFVDSSGQAVSFSTADLDTIVGNYDPSQEEAPLVKGHPKTDAPAYGWVESLKRVKNFLLAKPHKVAAEFKAAVNEGRWDKISVKLEDLALKHVGFLGAALPAVSGLGTAKLSAEDKGRTIELAMNDSVWSLGWKLVSVGRALQRFRDQLIEDKGVEAADKVIPSYLIEDLVAPPKYDTQNAFSEAEDLEDPMTDAEKQEFETLKREKTELAGQVATLTAANAEKDGKITALEAAQIATQDDAWKTHRDEFCADLQKKGIIVAADMETVKAQLDLARTAGKGEFSSGKNEHLTKLKTFMLSQKPKVKVGAPLREGVQPLGKDPAVIAKKAQEYAAQQKKDGHEISMTEAVAHVMKESAE